MSVKKWILAHLLQFDRQLSRARCACSGKMIPFYGRSILRTTQCCSISVERTHPHPFPDFSSVQYCPVLCACTVELSRKCMPVFHPRMRSRFCEPSHVMLMSLFLFILSNLLSAFMQNPPPSLGVSGKGLIRRPLLKSRWALCGTKASVSPFFKHLSLLFYPTPCPSQSLKH